MYQAASTGSRLILFSSLAVMGAGCAMPLHHQQGQQTLEISSEGLDGVDVRTHNGSVRFTPSGASDAPIVAVATITVGAATPEGAEAALADIELFSETHPDDGAIQKIGWKWRADPHPGCTVEVELDVTLPARLAIEGHVHNGELVAHGTEGACRLFTHNGRVRVLGGGTPLVADTQNGTVQVHSPATEVQLRTHNGKVEADLTSTSTLSGNIECHNGKVELTLNPAVSVELECKTHNGRVRNDLSLDDEDRDRRRLRGRMNGGETLLRVSTHNGNVELRAPDQDDVDEDEEDEDDEDDEDENVDYGTDEQVEENG